MWAKINSVVCALALLFAWCVPARAADPAAADLPTRIELHPIPTLTLSDQQFLVGEASFVGRSGAGPDAATGKPVTIAGMLRLPRGSGKFPVVVLVHGSGGPAAGGERWARELTEMGIASFMLDGFSGRGLTSTNSNQALLGRTNLILDAYRALDVLAKHPLVDPKRIALMGFSRGGQTTLYASLARFHKMWNTSGIGFAAYVPFYPDCKTTFVGDTETTGAPIRIFHGEADDYNPAAPCAAFVGRLKAAGRDAAITLYPGAHHAFDNPHGAAKPTVAPASQSVRACTIVEQAGGVLVESGSGAPFTYANACVQLGPHLGYDAAATQASTKAVKDFLLGVFKPS